MSATIGTGLSATISFSAFVAGLVGGGDADDIGARLGRGLHLGHVWRPRRW